MEYNFTDVQLNISDSNQYFFIQRMKIELVLKKEVNKKKKSMVQML